MQDALSKIPVIRNLAGWYARKYAPVYLVSFPKCGRTWLRVMLGKVLQEHFGAAGVGVLEVVEPKHRRRGFRGIKFIHDDSAHWKKPEELTERKDRYRYKKVILLVRDPRDVIVSLYFEKHNRLSAYVNGEKKQYRDVAARVEPFAGDLSSYLAQPVGGFDTILRFYQVWDQNRDVPDELLLVRYEDVHEDPAGELRRIVDFIGLNGVSDGTIRTAAGFAAFDNMHRMEKENGFHSASLRPADAGASESYKTRKGKVGGYIEYLSPEETLRLTARMREVLAGTFGYGGD
ncbi:MAG: sulfotransferase domain-containing protein [Thermodesulfobacteriota bacterium]